MDSRHDATRKIALEIDAFKAKHGLSDQQILAKMAEVTGRGTNTKLLQIIRANGNVTLETIGRLKQTLEFIDPQWRWRLA